MAVPPAPRPTRASAAGPPKSESPVCVRCEYRTPVNHIMGYSELLIEEAGERHLEALIPVFQRIHEGGRELLESIQSAFSEDAGPGKYWEGEPTAKRSPIWRRFREPSGVFAS
jgi:hypothetical protein